MIARETEEYMRGIIGLDVGTTHIKAILFSPEGEVIREEKDSTPLRSDACGSVYEPLEIWKIAESQLKRLCVYAQGNVDGISITGMAEAGLIVNVETGQEETDILPWFETRTAALAAGTEEKQDAERFKTTGLRNSFKYGIYKFLWLLEHTHVNRETAVWLSMCDYIAFKLTGQLVTEPGFAARGGFDFSSGILYGPFVDGGWFYMANIPSSGHSVEWFRKKL